MRSELPAVSGVILSHQPALKETHQQSQNAIFGNSGAPPKHRNHGLKIGVYSSMAGIPVTAFTVLVVTVFSVAAADPVAWGPTMSGLRMSISVLPDDGGIGRQLQVTIQNVGGNDLLVPLGIINNTKACADKLKFVLTMADGKHPRVIFTGMPGVISGRLDALVVPLLSGASYTFRMPMDKYYVLDGSEKLAVFCSRFCQIQVEMKTKNVVCPPYGYPNPNMLTCWQDTLPSNAITLDSPAR